MYSFINYKYATNSNDYQYRVLSEIILHLNCYKPLILCNVSMCFVLTARVKMSIKVRVNTCFQLYSGDLKFFTPEPYYDVEIPNGSNFAALRLKLFQTWPISSLRYNVEFNREWFGASTLNDGDNVEDGTTLFAVIYLKEQMKF